MKRKLLWAAFAIYCIVMLWLLFGQRIRLQMPEDYWLALQRNLSLRPLDTIRRFWWVIRNSPQPGLRMHAFVNLAGNVAMFLPLGFCLPALWQKLRKFWRFGLCTAGIILLVELVQLFALLGTFDVDDILLNLVGAAMGYGIWLLLGKKP